jgi:uncharacterized protein (DUF1810 family)
MPPFDGRPAGAESCVVRDPFALQRFVDAQDGGGTYDQALRELQAGRKHSHWMWFVFPQVAGLGSSPMAQHYAISGLPEARAYLAHPVLGQRLLECARTLTGLGIVDPERILGEIDAQKLRSSMTLFAAAAPDEPAFREVLDQYFGGEPDEVTTSHL